MTSFKWFKNGFFLSLNTSISMIVSPNIFRQIQRQSFLAETAFSRQSSFQVTPESFQTIDMVSLATAVLTWVRFYPAMNLAISRNSGLAVPALRTNRISQLHPSGDQRQSSPCFDIRNHLCPNLLPRPKTPKTGLLKVPLPRILPPALARCLLWFHCAPI